MISFINYVNKESHRFHSLCEILMLLLGDFRGLESIKDREVCCYMISCKDSINIDVVIDWLIKHSKTAK